MTHSGLIADHSNQNLVIVPHSVLEMSSLKMLYLNGNLLESLPDIFFHMLPKLNWLDIRKNKLKSLPVSIGCHKFLENLLLQGNLIEHLPNELGLVPNLKVLQLSENPITYPPSHIIDAGVDDIVIFLKQEYYKLNSNAPMVKPVSDNYSLISSTDISIAASEEDLPINQQTQTLEDMPALIVKNLSKHAKKRKESLIEAKCSRNKRIHEIIKSPSKFSVRSHYNSDKYLGMKEGKSHDQRIVEQELKDMWLSRLKALISDQEKIIQQERNLGALSAWRIEKKEEVPRPSNVLEKITEAPFDTDPEYNRLMSRTDMTEGIEKLIQAKRKTHSNVDIETMITDVVSKLRGIEHKLQEPVSPAEKLKNAEHEIQMIVELHKKIAQMQLSNDKL